MEFWRNPAFQVFVSSLIYMIPSFLDLSNIFLIPEWLQLVLFGITIVVATILIMSSLKKVYGNPEKILELIVKSIFPEELLPKIRANVMVYEKNRLKIKYTYNMQGMPDRNLELVPNQGCAGVAFAEGRPYAVDLTKEPHEKYRVLSDKVWKDMKSIISLPIKRFINKKEKIIGVLNIDSSLPMDEVMFTDPTVILILSGYATILGELI